MKTLILNSQDIEASVSLDALRDCMRDALKSLSTQRGKNFPRTVATLNSKSVLGFMPAYDVTQEIVGYKTVSVFHENTKRGINPHQGIVALLDLETGRVKCLLDGSTLTALRTAAVSAAATEILSRKESKTLALIGAGRQAFEHVRAITKIRNIEQIFVYARSNDAAKQFLNRVESQHASSVNRMSTPKDAVVNADIVVTCTSSKEPLLEIEDFSDGVHINAIGACRPGFREIVLRNHPKLKIYLDSHDACAREAEEIIRPLQIGSLSSPLIMGELGDCLDNNVMGRKTSSEITLFKSVGVGLSDIFAAHCCYQAALIKGIGQEVQL